MESLALGFVALTIVVAALAGGPVAQFVASVALLGALLAAATLLLVRLGLDRHLARALAGVSLTFVTYAALPPLLDLRLAALVDQPLWDVERAWFGTTAVEVLLPFVNDALTLVFGLVYGIHALLFFVPAILHWRADRRERAQRLLLAMSLAMHIGFVGYAIWPAYGPGLTMTHLPPLSHNAATRFVADYGTALGTFPSLHAGICAIVAIDGWRTSARWGVVFTGVAVAIWLSTIYLRYHWVPDLLAGLALATFAYWLAGILTRWRSP